VSLSPAGSLLGIKGSPGENIRFSTGSDMSIEVNLIKIFWGQKTLGDAKLLHKQFKIESREGSGQLKCK
jgi:hypothetical protein